MRARFTVVVGAVAAAWVGANCAVLVFLMQHPVVDHVAAAALRSRFVDVAVFASAQRSETAAEDDVMPQPSSSSSLPSAPTTAVATSNGPQRVAGCVVPERDKPGVQAFFGIVTRLEQKARRTAIRETWLTVDPGSIGYKFFVGVPENKTLAYAREFIATEVVQYSDVVLLEGFMDTYRNLTKKTVALLLWSYANENFDFLVKIDDDIFPNIRGLLDTVLQPHIDSLDVYMGDRVWGQL
eukprot:TRINITY_DN2572_c0_g1_i1.p1 TRINITY_DN2572_c0_g1~~TRINITY_DN2572_c0_g1_i1.p1  ORF type:complete len:254 (+),score=56.31 TRINITY_DN2572_c0_g1_i1:47-763(+)